MAQPRILMVLTSHSRLGASGEATGLRLEEFAAPCYAFAAAGLTPEIATIKGGAPAIDPKSAEGDARTEAVERVLADEALRAALDAAPRLGQVATLGYDAVFLPGGHGAIWDFTTSPELTVMLEQFHLTGKPIAAVSQALAALAPVMDRFGRPLVRDRRISVATDEEARLAGVDRETPFMLETKMRQLGAEVVCAAPFQPQVSVDGNLITGQNAASAALAAEAMIELLRGVEVAAA